MHRTESLDHLHKFHRGKEDQSKKRSNRSRSKNKPKSARTHRQSGKSPSTTRLLSYDPSFEHFDIPKHEGEVQSYRKAKQIDFKSIVYGAQNKTPRSEHSKYHQDITTTSESMQVLKAPNIPPTATSESPFDPICTCEDNDDDDDDATIVSETETVLHIPLSPRSAQNKNIRNSQTAPAKNPKMTKLVHASDFENNEISSPPSFTSSQWSSVSTNVDAPPQRASTESLHFSLEELDDWESIFTRTYKEEQASIENSNIDSWKKMEQLHNLYRSWVEDLYEQLDKFYDTFEEFQQATLDDRDEFSKEINSLHTQLNDSQMDLSHEQGKVAMLEKENDRNVKTIEKLQIKIATLKVEEAEKLQQFSQRLQQQETNFDANNNEKLGKAQEEYEKLVTSIEQFKAKIFLKERRLQKLNIEEQAMKCRLRSGAKEEFILQKRIDSLEARGTMGVSSSAGEGRCDTDDDKELNECWLKLSSGAD